MGQFENDTITGKGIMEYEDKRMLYEGMFVAGSLCGKGKLAFSNGMHYEGDWAEDDFCGEGILHLPDGRHIKGTWHEGNLVDGEMVIESDRKSSIGEEAVSRSSSFIT
jgi:hypothetical protein